MNQTPKGVGKRRAPSVNRLMVGRDLGIPVGCVVGADDASYAVTAVG